MILGEDRLREYTGLGLRALKSLRKKEGFPLLYTKEGNRPFTVHELVVDWARNIWESSSFHPDKVTLALTKKPRRKH